MQQTVESLKSVIETKQIELNILTKLYDSKYVNELGNEFLMRMCNDDIFLHRL